MEQNTINVTLTPAEKSLAARIQFDEQVLRAVKSAVGRDIEPYEQDYPSSGDSVYKYVCGAEEEAEGKGFTVKISDVYDNGSWRVGELQNVREVLPAGCSAFQTEDMCYRSGVTILKTADPYDIIHLVSNAGLGL